MGSEMMNKTEKLQWFEKKLNKWVKLFEESEKESGLRHNDMIDKVNEVDRFYKGACKGLDKRIKGLEKGTGIKPSGGGAGGGGGADGGGADNEFDLGGKSSDDVSDLSRQTAKRMNKVKTTKSKNTSPSPTAPSAP